MTPEEKTLIQNELKSFEGAGPDVIVQKLNTDGSALVEKWVVIPVSEQKINIHKAVLLAEMSPAERQGLRALLADTSEAAKDFKMLYDAATEFTVNHPTTQAMLDSLVAVIGLKAETAGGVKRLGQRRISRAEELIGRKITIEDVEEAR